MAKPVRKKKPQLSPEETVYRNAVGLMDAIDCVSRFEQAAISLKSAADQFEGLGDYKDAVAFREECLRLRDKLIREGTVDVMKKARRRQKTAGSKSEYADAIENYRRVIKYEYKVEECKRHIAECEMQIGRIETRLVWMRRLKAVVALVVLAVLFCLTPFYPMVKGVIHQNRGEYRAAINCYKSINGGLGTDGRIKSCFFHLGEEQFERENYRRALTLYKKAEEKEKAPERACEIEAMLLKEAEPGETVPFGESKWIVLEKRKDELMLLRKDLGQQTAFDNGDCDSYESSELCHTLNQKFLSNHFSEVEKAMLVPLGSIPAKEDDSGEKKESTLYFQLPNTAVMTQYKELIPKVKYGFWLSDVEDGQAAAVAEDGSITWKAVTDEAFRSRPLCVVSTSK